MTTKAVTTADVILSAIRTEFQNCVELRGQSMKNTLPSNRNVAPSNGNWWNISG